MQSDELGTRVLEGLAEKRELTVSGSKFMPGRSDSIPTVSVLGVRVVIPVMGVVTGVAIPVMGAVTGGILTAEEEGRGWGHMVT